MIFRKFIFICCAFLPLQLVLAKPLDSLPKECHFSSQFEQTKKLSSLPVPLKSSGSLYFSCQAGLIWQTKLPIKEEMVLTIEKVHFQQSYSNQTNQLEIIDSIQTQFLSKLLIGLMSVDEAYIHKTFLVETLSENQFKLIPKKNPLKRVIENIKISSLIAEQELLINIEQKDQTKLSIRSFAPTILKNSESHSAQCELSTHSKILCEALFHPIKTASKLDENFNE